MDQGAARTLWNVGETATPFERVYVTGGCRRALADEKGVPVSTRQRLNKVLRRLDPLSVDEPRVSRRFQLCYGRLLSDIPARVGPRPHRTFGGGEWTPFGAHPRASLKTREVFAGRPPRRVSGRGRLGRLMRSAQAAMDGSSVRAVTA